MSDPTEPLHPDREPSGLTLSPGTRVAHFRVLRELGRGGFGIVHLAEDLEIPGRAVALKTVPAGSGAPDAERLRHEAAALAALHHPHILVVHEVGVGPSGIFLAEEYMPGGSVAERIAAGPLPEAEALTMARDAADALAAAHRAGIVHRDFKPANLLRTADGLVKVADFGLALRGGAGAPSGAGAGIAGAIAGEDTVTAPLGDGRRLAGTPAYMPPEVFEGHSATALGDQFAFGVTLHEMLSGRRPTRGVPSVAPGFAADLEGIVARTIARDPARRFPDMRAVVEALDDAVLRRSPERRRARRVVVLSVLLVAILVAGWYGWRWSEQRRARALNERGRASLERGDRDEARAAFVEAHSADPGYLPACTNLGQLAAIESTPDWAVTILRDCARQFPDAAAVRYNLGAALGRTGRRAEASAELTKALGLARDSSLRPLVVNELARTMIADGRAADATALVVAEHPDPAASLEGALLTRTLVVAHLEAGQPEAARAALEATLEGKLTPSERPATLAELGRALEALGRSADARENYSRAIVEGATGEAADLARAGLARMEHATR